MYKDFYVMTKTPFTRGMLTDVLYTSSELIEVLNRLTYVAQRQLFSALVGDYRTGITTILRKFQDSLDDNQYLFLYLSDSSLYLLISDLFNFHFFAISFPEIAFLLFFVHVFRLFFDISLQ